MDIIPCPFCGLEMDTMELCFHIDDEHPVQAKNGVFFLVVQLLKRSSSSSFLFCFFGPSRDLIAQMRINLKLSLAIYLGLYELTSFYCVG